MKNLLKFAGIIAFVAIIGFSMAGCVTATSIGGAVGTHGLFSGNGAGSTVSSGAQEIGSYSIILGLFDAGFADYAAAVKQAEAAGKKVTSVTKFLFVLYTVTAYAE